MARSKQGHVYACGCGDMSRYRYLATCTMAQQRKRCSYDLSFKLKAIMSAEKTSKEAAARQFGVDARRIREWCGQKTTKRRPRFNAGPVLTPVSQ